MILAVVLSLGVSVWTTLYYAYESGANNANTWFFLSGPRYTVDFAASYLRDPAGPDYSGLGLMALGGAVMTALYWIRSHLLTFPIHPMGFAVSQMMLTRHIWFSVFLVWLFKAVLTRYGGPRVLKAVRPFFLGTYPRSVRRYRFLADRRPDHGRTGARALLGVKNGPTQKLS